MQKLNSKFENTTVILLNNSFENARLTRDEVREKIGVKKVNFYKNNEYEFFDLMPLITAVDIVSNLPVKYSGHDLKKIHVTEMAVVNSCSVKGSLLKTAYPNHVVDGFVLDCEGFEKIANLAIKHALAEVAYLNARFWISKAEKSAQSFIEYSITDSSVTNIEYLSNINETYAVQALIDLHSEASQWVTQNRWK